MILVSVVGAAKETSTRITRRSREISFAFERKAHAKIGELFIHKKAFNFEHSREKTGSRERENHAISHDFRKYVNESTDDCTIVGWETENGSETTSIIRESIKKSDNKKVDLIIGP